MKKDHKKCICGKPARRWSDYCQKCDVKEYERYMENHGDAENTPIMNGFSRDAGNQGIMNDFPR